MFLENRFFGHSTALYNYGGGTGAAPPLWGYLQHGWFDGEPPFPREKYPAMYKALPKLLWNQDTLKLSAEMGRRNLVPIGSPFVYFTESAGVDGSTKLASPRTLVYPHHGWERGDLYGDHARYISEIEEREAGRSITICLGWKEFEDVNVRKVYEEAGFEVVTNGRRFEPGFYQRQMDQILRADRIVTNRLSTATWYGAWLRREIEVYGQEFGCYSPEEGIAACERIRRRHPELTRGPVSASDVCAFAELHLGVEFLRPPEEIMEICGWRGLRRALGPLGYAAVLVRRRVKRLPWDIG